MSSPDDVEKLCADLDAVAEGEKPTRGLRRTLREPNSFYARRRMTWRGSMLPLAEHVTRALRYGRLAREHKLRGVTVDGEVQFVLDPALLARFGFPDDPNAKDMAELAGYPQYPYALDSDQNPIPVWSTRWPRPQRKHREDSPSRLAVGEHLSGADAGEPLSAAGMPSEWTPDDPPTPAPTPWTPDLANLGLQPWSRGVRAPPKPPRVRLSTPSSPAAKPPRVMSALEADLREHLARGVKNNRPRAIPITYGIRADDPVENGA